MQTLSIIFFVCLTALVVVNFSLLFHFKSDQVRPLEKSNCVSETTNIVKHIPHKQLVTLKKEQIFKGKTDIHSELFDIKQQLHNLAWTQHQQKLETYKFSEQATKQVILIEGRDHHLLEASIRNITTTIKWPLLVIGTQSNQKTLQTLQKQYDITYFILNRSNLPIQDYNEMLVSTSFWEHRVTADHVLLTQTDAWLCSNPKLDINEYLIYDYVGAPWHENQLGGISNLVGNCGLCLCNRKAMLNLCRKIPFKTFRKKYNTEAIDLYFSTYILNKPSSIVAQAFSVENVWFASPVGVHKPFLLDKDILKELEKHCSGVSILENY